MAAPYHAETGSVRAPDALSTLPARLPRGCNVAAALDPKAAAL